MATKKKKTISSSDKKKLNSATTSKEDKKKILKKYGLENDATTLSTYKVDKALTNAEISALKSSNISHGNKMSILSNKGLQNNATVLDTYGVDQNAFTKPADYVDQYSNQINDLSTQLRDFYNNSERYNSKYIPTIEALQQSLDDGSYFDPETDARAVQYRNDYTRGGQQAMSDTMANAALRTGGLASSYAQAAAQKQYNDYMDQMAGKIMDLRDLAEKSVRNNINNYWNLENDAYGKYKNDYNAAYGNLTDALANYRNLSDTDRSRYMQDIGNYENYRAYKENQRQYDKDLAYRYAALAAQQEARESAAADGLGYTGGGGSSRSYSGGSSRGSSNSSSSTSSYTSSGLTPYEKYTPEQMGKSNSYSYTPTTSQTIGQWAEEQKKKG